MSRLSRPHRLKTRVVQDLLDGQPVGESLRSDYRWRVLRAEFVVEQPVCQLCRRDQQLEVHHALPWAVAHHLRHDPRNLVTLCRACHLRFGHLNNWREYNPQIFQLVRVVQQKHPQELDWGREVAPEWLEEQLWQLRGPGHA